jgi:DNA replication licensing factor MCM5
LKRKYNLQQYYLNVQVEDLASFDEGLAEKLKTSPAEHLPLVCGSYFNFISHIS